MQRNGNPEGRVQPSLRAQLGESGCEEMIVRGGTPSANATERYRVAPVESATRATLACGNTRMSGLPSPGPVSDRFHVGVQDVTRGRVAAACGRAVRPDRATATDAGLPARFAGPGGPQNSWQIAEHAGHSTPYGLQRLLPWCQWDPDEAVPRKALPTLSYTAIKSHIPMSGCGRHGLRAAKSFQPSSGDKLTAIPGVLGLTDPTNDRRGPAPKR